MFIFTLEQMPNFRVQQDTVYSADTFSFLTAVLPGKLNETVEYMP